MMAVELSSELNQSSSSGSNWNNQEFPSLDVTDEEEEVTQQPIEKNEEKNLETSEINPSLLDYSIMHMTTYPFDQD